MKRVWMALVILAVAAAGGYYYYTRYYVPSHTAAASTTAPLQVATVRRGDIVISAQGAGSLVPASQLDLAFSSSGKLVELDVAVGDHVTAGQVVARQDDTAAKNAVAQAEFNLAQAQQTLASLTSPTAIAAAQLDVVNKQTALTTAQKALKSLPAIDVDTYADALASAQAAYDNAATSASLVNVGSGSAQRALQAAQDAADTAYSNWQHDIIWYGEYHGKTTTAKAAYDLAAENLQVAQVHYDQTIASENTSVASAQDALTTAQNNYNAAKNYKPSQAAQALAEANLAVAQANLDQAQATLAEIKDGVVPTGTVSSLSVARNSVTQAQLALTTAQQSLANVELASPISGTVTAVNGTVGATVGTSTLLTVADLDNAQVQFYIDESDLADVQDGYPISVVFDAAPETTLTGKVLRVDPALVSVNNTSVVRAYATLDPAPDAVRLISGMNGTVEITAGEARNALLVPIEALRELGTNSYAVFVVGADGKLTFTPVTVGLRDVANAEITSGLKQGDVVSTGVVETTP